MQRRGRGSFFCKEEGRGIIIFVRGEGEMRGLASFLLLYEEAEVHLCIFSSKDMDVCYLSFVKGGGRILSADKRERQFYSMGHWGGW